MKFLAAIVLLLLPAIAQAADISGIPKIREGDQIQIGTARIRLGGIDAPSVDQLCLDTQGERWTCGVAARDEHAERFVVEVFQDGAELQHLPLVDGPR